MIPAVDFFCGLGGWTLGAKEAGARVLLAVNHDVDAIAWHEAGHPDVPTHRQDLAEFPMDALGSSLKDGVLLASPVCKGFSDCGQPSERGVGGNGRIDLEALRQRRRNDRNTAWAVVAAAEAARPRLILSENVTGMMTKWPLWGTWTTSLQALGYHVRAHALQARAYGAPQERERLIVTASLDAPLELAESWGRPGGTIGETLETDPRTHRWALIDEKPERTRRRIREEQAKAGRTVGLFNNVSESNLRALDLDPWPTLTTKGGTQLYHVEDDRARVVNPREIARAMGLPDHVPLPKNRGLAARLVGNMIPVPLAQGVCEQALQHLTA